MASTPGLVPHSKYFRHRLYSRLRYGRKLKAFLTAEAAKFVSAGATPQAVSPVHVSNVQAHALVTFSANPANNDTIHVNGRVYTFKDTLTTAPTTVADEVKIGTGATDTRTNFNEAIAATGGGGAGTDFSTGTLVSATVTAGASVGNSTLTAIVAGAAGNLITLSSIEEDLSVSDAVTCPATLGSGVTETFGPTWTATGNSIKDDEGPLFMTAVVMPAGAPTGELWAKIISTDVLSFANSLENLAKGNYIHVTASGTTVVVARGVTTQAVFDLLKTDSPLAMTGAADIDTLA
jgi:hypothetical protein